MRHFLFILMLANAALPAYSQPRVNDPGKKLIEAKFLNKSIRYPADLIGKKSGFVVYTSQMDDGRNLSPLVLYNSHELFLQHIDSIFNAHPTETLALLKRYRNDVLIFEFITFSSPDHKKIYSVENRHFFKELSEGRKQFYLTVECWERWCYK